MATTVLSYVIVVVVVLAWNLSGVAASWNNAPDLRRLDADVLILGGGMSGIAAARTLRDARKSFLLLEAMDQIGGRIRDTMMGGARVELGANWLEGLDPGLCPSKCHPSSKPSMVNPIYSLFLNSKLNYTCTNERSLKVYERGGRLVPTQQAAEVRYGDRLSECMETEWRKYPTKDISAREALHKCGWRPQTSAEELIDWFAHDFYYTQTPDASSCAMAYPLQTYADFGTCSVFVVDQEGGYGRIVRDLAHDLADGIRVNAVVDQIRWHDGGGTKRVCVTATDRLTGERSDYCAARAIVTFSLGVLQSNETQASFRPPLPAQKLKAINELHMGYYLKMFLRFDKTFWDTDVQFIGHASSHRGHYPLFQPLNSRDGHFLPPDTHILVATATGSEALRISRQPKSDTEEELLSVLRSIYPHHDARLLESIVPDWNVNRFFRGAYSNAPLLSEGFPDLSTPVGPLYFGGEATSKYYGFVHGAYVAGIETAKAVLDNMANSTVLSSSYVYGF